MDKMDKDELLISHFMQGQPMAVISTISADSLRPESALVAFAQTEQLEIIFETFVDTRKWCNLQKNQHVSLVIGWDIQRYITVQYEGVVTAIPGDETEEYTKIFLKKDTPCTETFLRDRRVRLFKVRPMWIRYSDYSSSGTPNIIEKTYR
jgi:general stress protein 26